MTEFLGREDHPEIKKLEQQLIMVEEDMRDQELQYETSDDDVLTPQRALKYLKLIMRFL